MSDRRPRVEGLKLTVMPLDPNREKEFVFGEKAKLDVPVERVVPPQSCAPLTTRIRADFATALKRASLERQLSGTPPNTLQGVLEEALEPWLRTHGYVN